jgi:hypothetical protein
MFVAEAEPRTTNTAKRGTCGKQYTRIILSLNTNPAPQTHPTRTRAASITNHTCPWLKPNTQHHQPVRRGHLRQAHSMCDCRPELAFHCMLCDLHHDCICPSQPGNSASAVVAATAAHKHTLIMHGILYRLQVPQRPGCAPAHSVSRCC